MSGDPLERRPVGIQMRSLLSNTPIALGEAGKGIVNSEECMVNERTGEESMKKKTSDPHGDPSGKVKRGDKGETAAAAAKEQLR